MRLLNPLLAAGVITALVQPVPLAHALEGAPPAPSLGRTWDLPAPPVGHAVTDAVLTGDVTWAVLDSGNADDLADRTLWTTASDGSGEWRSYPTDSEPFQVDEITSAGGSAITVLFGAHRTALVWPGGRRDLDSTGTVAPGGRLVLVSNAHEITVETLGGEVVGTGDYRATGAGDGRVWTSDGTRLTGDPVAPDAGGTLVVDTHEAVPCVEGPMTSRGRWVVAECFGETLVADTSGALRPGFLEHAPTGIGDGFLVGLHGGWRIIDPVTLGSSALPDAVEVLPDAADGQRVLLRYRGSRLRIAEVDGLAPALPPDTAPPDVHWVSVPETVDLSAARRQGITATRDFRWDSSSTEPFRYEVRAGGRPTPVTAFEWATSVAFLPSDPQPCVDVRAVDRAGNASTWQRRCSVWDGVGPTVVRTRFLASMTLPPAVSFLFDGRSRDQSAIVGHVTAVRGGDRRGRMGATVVTEGDEYDTREDVTARRGTRRCIAIGAVDEFGNAGEPYGGCVTVPYDDTVLRGGSHATTRIAGTLGASHVTLRPGAPAARTTEALYGRVVVAKVRRGPSYGVAELLVGNRAVRRFDLRSARDGWRWVTYVSPTSIDSTVAVRSARGLVRLDALGISRPGDVYPPRQ